MGRALAERYAVASDTFAEADAVLGFPVSVLCFEGPEEDLTDTVNAQPALLATSVAALRVLQKVLPNRPQPLAVAGHSMGEYSALVAAGCLSFADGVRLVRERGRLMKRAGLLNPGGMAAILGLEAETVFALCEQARAEAGGVVQVANDNCPGQTVISGDEMALERAMALAGKLGARKVVRLAVSIAAHSPLMEPAAAALRQAIESTTILEPSLPVIGNVQAAPLTSAHEIRKELAAQLTSPVRWADSMRCVIEAGVDQVVELGPGDVLSALMKRIDRRIGRCAVGDPEGIAKLDGSG